jgi:hypothetical protein
MAVIDCNRMTDLRLFNDLRCGFPEKAASQNVHMHDAKADVFARGNTLDWWASGPVLFEDWRI